MARTQSGLVILKPRWEVAPPPAHLAPRLETLDGKVIGTLWNTRPPGDKILRGVADVLGKRYALKGVVHVKKPFIGNVAPPDVIASLRGCDAVITGIGD